MGKAKAPSRQSVRSRASRGSRNLLKTDARRRAGVVARGTLVFSAQWSTDRPPPAQITVPIPPHRRSLELPESDRRVWRSLQASFLLGCDEWTRVSLEHPELPDAKKVRSVARILGAIHLAFSIGDDGPIAKLEDVSRPYLRGFEMDIEPATAVEQRERVVGLIERLWKESASAPDPESMAVRVLLELDRAGSPLALKIAQAGTVISKLRPGTRTRRDLVPAVKDAVKKAIVEELRRDRPAHRGDSVGERLLRRVLTELGLPRAGNQFTYKDMRSKRAGAASPGAEDDSK